jgi:hypothetical protein
MPRVVTVILACTSVESRRLTLLWTPADLAQRAKLSRQTTWCARTGRAIGVHAARRIARALGVSLRSLLASDTDAPPGDEAIAPVVLVPAG